jgi:tryptophanyl-tRNA synthetase
MSKSYDNTIPLFAPAAQLRKLIMGIVTDSKAPGEPKDTAGSALFQIYQAFASADETAALAKAFAQGIAWGDAKQLLFERIDREIAPMREKYETLIAHPAELDRMLLAGADKARQLASPFIRELRHAVGLRALASVAAGTAAAKQDKPALASFKQYRDKDGLFYFKMVSPGGQMLLQSKGFASPRDAGQTIARLQQEGGLALTHCQHQLAPLSPQEQALALSELDNLASHH